MWGGGTVLFTSGDDVGRRGRFGRETIPPGTSRVGGPKRLMPQAADVVQRMWWLAPAFRQR